MPKLQIKDNTVFDINYKCLTELHCPRCQNGQMFLVGGTPRMPVLQCLQCGHTEGERYDLPLTNNTRFHTAHYPYFGTNATFQVR